MNNISLKLYQIIVESAVSKDSLKGIPGNHLKIDENQPPFECYYCSEVYFDFKVFEIHLSQCDSNNCVITNCDEELVQQTIPKAFNCTFKFCNKSFKNSSDFSKHKRIHENDRR